MKEAEDKIITSFEGNPNYFPKLPNFGVYFELTSLPFIFVTMVAFQRETIGLSQSSIPWISLISIIPILWYLVRKNQSGLLFGPYRSNSANMYFLLICMITTIEFLTLSELGSVLSMLASVLGLVCYSIPFFYYSAYTENDERFKSMNQSRERIIKLTLSIKEKINRMGMDNFTSELLQSHNVVKVDDLPDTYGIDISKFLLQNPEIFD